MLQIILKFCKHYSDAIEGKLPDPDSAHVSGGSTISDIFHGLFATALGTIDPFDDLTDQRQCLFVVLLLCWPGCSFFDLPLVRCEFSCLFASALIRAFGIGRDSHCDFERYRKPASALPSIATVAFLYSLDLDLTAPVVRRPRGHPCSSPRSPSSYL